MDAIGIKIGLALKPHGYEARTVSIAHLPEVQESVGRLVRHGTIDKKLHAKWHFYLKSNEDMPDAKTIIILAMPQPLTRLNFEWRGRIFSADIPPTYFTRADISRAEKALTSVLDTTGHRLLKAHLALKTLAVRSGMAEYGRNNITYVPRMGSLYQLVAFYTDFPCEEDNWRESRIMQACNDCSLCRENCPTGSIVDDRFLIRAENCLGFLNEKEPDSPYWAKLQPDWPNALIGCMACQSVCPANKPYLHNITDGQSFSEEETGHILHKTPWEELPPETRQKLEELHWAYPLMSENLISLVEKQYKKTTE